MEDSMVGGLGSVLTKGSKGSLMGHQRKETRLQCICDYDVKQLFKVLPVRERETRKSYVKSKGGTTSRYT